MVGHTLPPEQVNRIVRTRDEFFWISICVVTSTHCYKREIEELGLGARQGARAGSYEANCCDWVRLSNQEHPMPSKSTRVTW